MRKVQVEASIKAKMSTVLLLLNYSISPEVASPDHLQTINSQNGIGQQEVMFYCLAQFVGCNSTGR